MSLVETFRPHLPFLRRYARALTGSQQSGDAYIRASLEALSADPDQIGTGITDGSEAPRIALYRLFHTIWSTTGAALQSQKNEIGNSDLSPLDRLETLSPLSRQAYLLTMLEGFTRNEAAIILSLSPAEVDELVDTAQRDIESELRTNVLIIEDEAIIAADLEALVTELGHDVVGTAATRDEAVKTALSTKPGLILCDIQLADNSSGIDAAQDILASFDVPIIFITAFPERLLTGERPEPTYLISKPFQDNVVKAAIAQALFFHPAKDKKAA
jgi:CheY-like chemotaxis protein